MSPVGTSRQLAQCSGMCGVGGRSEVTADGQNGANDPNWVIATDAGPGGLVGCVGDHYFGFWPAPILKATGKLRPAEVRYASALRSNAARMAACVAAS
jgi:hypothetical protein